MRITRTAAAAALTALALTGVTACSSDDAKDTTSSATSEAGAAASSGAAAGSSATQDDASEVKVEDAWIKATDKDMTGVFGMIHNGSDAEAHVVAVSSDLTDHTELHETVPDGGAMTMREAKDGFRIPAGGDFELKPGANHVMLMKLTKPITTGQQVTITLELSDGTKVPFQATARSFQGGNENYQGDGAGMSSGAPMSGGAPSPAAADEHAGHGHG